MFVIGPFVNRWPTRRCMWTCEHQHGPLDSDVFDQCGGKIKLGSGDGRPRIVPHGPLTMYMGYQRLQVVKLSAAIVPETCHHFALPRTVWRLEVEIVISAWVLRSRLTHFRRYIFI